MFDEKSHKNNKKLWITLIVILVLVAVMIVLEAQILVMLKDLQASVFGGAGDVIKDINPLPPAKGNWIMDINPLPPIIAK
jgi:hypothetical protein